MYITVTEHPDPHCAHVHDSWGRSYLSRHLRWVPDGVAHCARVGHRAIRDELLVRCRVRAVSDPEYPEYIHGYAVWEVVAGGLVIHWVYVRAASRRQGIGRALLDDSFAHATNSASISYTHRTWFGFWCDAQKLQYRSINEVR